MENDNGPWYCVKQNDGGYWISPDEPTEGKWDKYNTWNEAYVAGMRHRNECDKKLSNKQKNAK